MPEIFDKVTEFKKELDTFCQQYNHKKHPVDKYDEKFLYVLKCVTEYIDGKNQSD